MLVIGLATRITVKEHDPMPRLTIASICLLLTVTFTADASGQLFRGGVLKRLFDPGSESDAEKPEANAQRRQRSPQRAGADSHLPHGGQQLQRQVPQPPAPGQSESSRSTSSYLRRSRPAPSPSPQSTEVFGLSLVQSRAGGPIVIQRVAPESQAAAAGLRRGDHLVSVGETTIESLSVLSGIEDALEAGDEIELEIERGQQTGSVKLQPIPSEATPASQSASSPGRSSAAELRSGPPATASKGDWSGGSANQYRRQLSGGEAMSSANPAKPSNTDKSKTAIGLSLSGSSSSRDPESVPAKQLEDSTQGEQNSTRKSFTLNSRDSAQATPAKLDPGDMDPADVQRMMQLLRNQQRVIESQAAEIRRLRQATRSVR